MHLHKEKLSFFGPDSVWTRFRAVFAPFAVQVATIPTAIGEFWRVFTHFDASYIRRGSFAVGIVADVTANWTKIRLGRLLGHFWQFPKSHVAAEMPTIFSDFSKKLFKFQSFIRGE